jgi:hypothetical protein
LLWLKRLGEARFLRLTQPPPQLIRDKQETFDRLAGDECIHNLRDVRGRDAPVKKVIGFD